ncbi:MAG: M24 family metallopeptidase [Sphingomonadales bacterium]|nr:M24 family metallopeptidase [Sphingomonadales bacterium]
MTRAMHFDEIEYGRRQTKVRQAMAARGIDLLVVSDPCNLYYLSGYDAWSFYVPQVLLLGIEDRPVWIGRAMDAAGAAITTRLPADDIRAYGDEYVQSATRHPVDFIVEEIKARGWRSARIGLEIGNYYLGARAYLAFADAFASDKIVDASLLVNWVRSVKSPAELDYMRQAARIVEGAMQAAYDIIRPGVRECDAAAEIYRALIGGTAEYGGNYASSPPLMPSGDQVHTPHLSWTDQPYRPGAQVNLELVASRHRYHTPLGRSVLLGEASPEMRRLEAALCDGIEAALAFIRPGVTAAEIDATWQAAAGRHGIQKAARCGYSIGIAYPPTFGEQTISIRPGDQTVMQPGMTLHLMPAVWLGSESLVMTEPFVVTDEGAECLCRFPRRLEVIR